MNVKSFFQKHSKTILAVTILFGFRWSFADHYRVPTGSMLPTIQLGDDILTNKMAYDFKIPFTEWMIAKTSNPVRGDIIVFKFPKDESINYVKRIIALPGETLKFKGSTVFINGAQLAESYLPEKLDLKNYQELEVTVPNDMYFVMGDNRDNSNDSRYWGFVPRKNIKGKVMKVLWNISFHEAIPTLDLNRFLQKL